jgi:phosphatidylglycerol:prolipoprotein diacylglycerol transferase
MFFPGPSGDFLRHPSQLYEAFLEGLVIFLILWSIRNNIKLRNKMFPLFLILYGSFRFFLEFVRDEQVLVFLTAGQYLSLATITVGVLLFGRKRMMVS